MKIAINQLEAYNNLASRGAKQAAKALSQMTGVRMRHDVTGVSLVSNDTLEKIFTGHRYNGVQFGLSGGPSGETVLVIVPESAGRLRKKLQTRGGNSSLAGGAFAELGNIMRRADTFLVPVLPSPIDMRAAARFLEEMRRNKRIQSKQAKYALIENRARSHTRVYQELDERLRRQRAPILTTLRDNMNYIRAAERGLGICELAPYATATDREQWQPVIRWLNSKRSKPA